MIPAPAPVVVESRFRAMASGVHVVLVEPHESALEYCRARLSQLEARWSRFRSDSELSLAIAAAGEKVRVSEDTLTLLAVMERGWVETGGRYDPTMLRQVVDAGYGKSIGASRSVSVTVDLPDPSRRIQEVALDRDGSTVWFPAGLGVDPGGVGKGLAADLLVGELLEMGTAGAMVSIGGDLFAGGRPPSGTRWRVLVEDPRDPESVLFELGLAGGGVATSSTLSRTWSHRGHRAHHVLDPADGKVSRTDLASVTAIAGTGWEAEVHATAALVAGREGALRALSGSGCSGVVVPLAGSTMVTADIEWVPAAEEVA